MEQWILWLNILGFAFIFASFGITFIVYSRVKTRWLSSYLIYLAAYAFFSLLNAYHFFSRVYLSPLPSLLDVISLAVTYLIGFLLVVIVPRFVFCLFSKEIHLKQKIFIYGMAGVCLALMVISLLFPEAKLDRVGTIFMNGYLGMLSLYGLMRLQRVKDRINFGVVVPFLYISSLFYFIIVAESIFVPLFATPQWELYISLSTAGLICISWGSGTLIYLILKNRRQENSISVRLTAETADLYGFTPREIEIINLLLYGNSNKEIGEKLFISTRTVESHMYNIYRKSSVRSKLELARKLSID